MTHSPVVCTWLGCRVILFSNGRKPLRACTLGDVLGDGDRRRPISEMPTKAMSEKEAALRVGKRLEALLCAWSQQRNGEHLMVLLLVLLRFHGPFWQPASPIGHGDLLYEKRKGSVKVPQLQVVAALRASCHPTG